MKATSATTRSLRSRTGAYALRAKRASRETTAAARAAFNARFELLNLGALAITTRANMSANGRLVVHRTNLRCHDPAVSAVRGLSFVRRG
jgi:hypothetical protein